MVEGEKKHIYTVPQQTTAFDETRVRFYARYHVHMMGFRNIGRTMSYLYTTLVPKKYKNRFLCYYLHKCKRPVKTVAFGSVQ